MEFEPVLIRPALPHRVKIVRVDIDSYYAFVDLRVDAVKPVAARNPDDGN